MRMGRRGRRLGVAMCGVALVQQALVLQMDPSLVRAQREEYR